MAKNLFLYTTILQIFVFVHFVEFVHAQTKKLAIPSWVAPRLDPIDRHNTLFSPNDSLLCTFTAHFAYIWNATDGSLVNSIPSAGIHEVVFNSSSNRILIHSGQYTLWNTKDGNRVVDIDIDGRSITDAKFNLSGDLVVAATTSGKIGLWNSITGKLLYSIKAHGIKVTSQTVYWTGRIRTSKVVDEYTSIRYVEFSRDGKLFLSVGDDGAVKIWNVSDGKLIKTISESIDLFPRHKYDDWRGRIVEYGKAIFHPHEDKILTADYDGKLKIWNSTTGVLLHEFESVNSRGGMIKLDFSVSYDTSGKLILVYPVGEYVDKYLDIYDATTGEPLNYKRDAYSHYLSDNNINFNYYQDIGNNTISIISTKNIEGDLYGVTDLNRIINLTDGRVIEESRYWFTSKSRKRAIVRNKNESGFYVVDTKTNTKVCRIKYFSNVSNDNLSVYYSESEYPPLGNNKLVYSDSYGRNCIIGLCKTVLLTRLDSITYNPLNCGIDDWIEWERNQIPHGFFKISFIGVNNKPDDECRAFAVIDLNGTASILRLWDVSNRRHIGDLDSLNDEIYYATFNTKGDRIYTFGNKGSTIWDSKNGNLINHFKHQFPDISDMSVSYIFNGKHDLLLCYHKEYSQDIKYRETYIRSDIISGFYVYDVNTGEVVHKMPDKSENINRIAMMENGDYLAYSTLDGTLKILDAKSGGIYKSLNVVFPVSSIQFSQDNKYIILALCNKTIEIRNIETGTIYKTIVYENYITAKMSKTKRDEFYLQHPSSLDDIHYMCLNKSNNILLMVNQVNRGNVHVWDVIKNKLLAEVVLMPYIGARSVKIDYDRDLLIILTSKFDVLTYSLKDFY